MRILYATDGSEGALSAGRFFAGIPHRRDIHVHIVTVLDPDDEDNVGQNILESSRAALGDFPGHVTTAIARAESTSEIVDTLLFTAAYVNADLFALGACGLSAMARFLLGSVSESIARHADIPVLLARASKAPLREIVVGVDGSETARFAAYWAAKTMPLPSVCSFHLVRVVTPPLWVWDVPPTGSGMTLLETDSALENAVSEGVITTHAYLEPLAKSLANSDKDAVTSETIVTLEVAVGQPAKEIVSVANERKSGLIVVGAHGLSDVQRFLLGSVSGNVARHAGCSVLVVRQIQKQEKGVF